jgi:hypothetical protein
MINNKRPRRSGNCPGPGQPEVTRMPINEATPTGLHGLELTRTEVDLAGISPVQVIEHGHGRCTVSVGHGRGAVSLHGSSTDALAFVSAGAERLGGAR